MRNPRWMFLLLLPVLGAVPVGCGIGDRFTPTGGGGPDTSTREFLEARTDAIYSALAELHTGDY